MPLKRFKHIDYDLNKDDLIKLIDMARNIMK